MKYKIIEDDKVIYTCWLNTRSFEKGLINIEKEISILNINQYNLNTIHEVKQFVAMLNYFEVQLQNTMFGPKWVLPTKKRTLKKGLSMD